MSERLLKSWTRAPLIVERDLPLIGDWRIGAEPSITAFVFSPELPLAAGPKAEQ